MNAQPPARTKSTQLTHHEEEEGEVEPFLIGGKPLTTSDQLQPVGDSALPDPKIDPDFYVEADYVKGEYGEDDADYPRDEYEEGPEGEWKKKSVPHGTRKPKVPAHKARHTSHKGATKKKSLFSSWK